MRKLLTIVFALCCSFFITACGDSNAATAYEKAAVEISQAIYSGKSDKVKSMLYFSKEELAEPGLKEMAGGKIEAATHDAKNKADSYGGLKQVTVVESEVNESGDRARVTVLAEFKNDPEAQIRDNYNLVKEGSSWKLKL